MPPIFNQPQASGVIDLTWSDDEDDHATASHAPIPQSANVATPSFHASSMYTSIVQESLIPSHHGLPLDDFHSGAPWPYTVSRSQTSGSHAYRFANGQPGPVNPAKRMRVGEKPPSLFPTYSPATHSTLPESLLKILHQDVQRVGTSAEEGNVSAHTALKTFNEGFSPGPRKVTQRKTVSAANRIWERPYGMPKVHDTNSPQVHTIEPRPHDEGPARSNSGSSSDVEITGWRRKESPQHTIIKNAQRNQIIPHVREFIREFGEGLPEDETRRVGKEVSAKICNREAVNPILTNQGSIPHHYEVQLVDLAQVLAKKMLDNTRSRINDAGSVSSQSGSSHDGHPDIRHTSPTSALPILQLQDSSSGSEIDQVFDRPSVTNRPTPSTPPELSELSVEPDILWLISSERASLTRLNDPTTSEQASHPKESDSRTKNVTAVDSDSELSSCESLNESDIAVDARRKTDLEREERRYRLFGLDPTISRPYLSAQDRSDLQRGLEITNAFKSKIRLTDDERQLLCGKVFHVDFVAEEMAYMADVIAMVLGMKVPAASRKQAALRDEITRMMKGRCRDIPKIAGAALRFDQENRKSSPTLRLIKRRGKAAVTSFLKDAVDGSLSAMPKLAECHSHWPRAALRSSPESINSLLLQREVFGRSRTSGSQREVKAELTSFLEDTIIPYRQWMDCSGDVIALAWDSQGTRFVCGATAHSDSHNQQYNKPGNLMFGSTHSESMRARPDHKIPRPVIVKGGNSIEVMREIQDPWLYSSVVSVAYSSASDAFFTSSFDKTVKIWGESPDEVQPDLLGTWPHKGNVNFVVTSENHGLVATTCDIVRDAIRVYTVDIEDVSNSKYVTYSGLKANEQVVGNDKTWAYFPATIAWAKCSLLAHLLLVGYSPRSTAGNDNDIPEDKRNFGELCLWDVSLKKRIDVWPRSQNIFEVVWHPTQPVFFAATAPSGMYNPWVRTQIRVFAMTKTGAFSQTRALDCCALDINEITVMPSSGVSSYVTASCTNGKVYVWDTALGDLPIQVLEHGDSIDDGHCIELPKELSDNGVKFSAWGASPGRFYTGSSDGLVKAWDLRRPCGQAFVRDVARLSGGVSAGAFSPDMTHLLIGDATGKVHLLNVKETEPAEELPKVCPKLVTPHPQPSEDSKWAGKGGEISSDLIRNGVIVIHENREVGAVQGPAYDTKKWYCPAAHQHGDPKKPLLPEFASKQQWNRIPVRGSKKRGQLSLPRLPKAWESVMAKFSAGLKLEFDLSKLDTETRRAMKKELWTHQDEYDFVEEEEGFRLGGKLVKKLRKGEDWEENWVELDKEDWVDLEGVEHA